MGRGVQRGADARGVHRGLRQFLGGERDHALVGRLHVDQQRLPGLRLELGGARGVEDGGDGGLVLEVAEHLPHAKAELFVDNLVAHGDVILFSAAVPHQGGEHHVNEQPPEYWRQKFKARGYDVFDFVRPALTARGDVMPWYRFNTYVYANAAGQERLSDKVKATRVPDGQELEIGGDLKWALRRAAVRLIPTALVKPIAMAKAKLEAAAKK